jgi:hypothetical protein
MLDLGMGFRVYRGIMENIAQFLVHKRSLVSLLPAVSRFVQTFSLTLQHHRARPKCSSAALITGNAIRNVEEQEVRKMILSELEDLHDQYISICNITETQSLGIISGTSLLRSPILFRNQQRPRYAEYLILCSS